MRWMRQALMGLAVVMAAQAQEADLTLTDAAADRFAVLALKCARQEYPNKLDHVMNSAEEVNVARRLVWRAKCGLFGAPNALRREQR